MVRTYKRKTKKRENDDSLLCALQAIEVGMSTRAAALQFGLPEATVRRHKINNEIESEAVAPKSTAKRPTQTVGSANLKMAQRRKNYVIKSAGAQPIFTPEAEQALEDYILHTIPSDVGLTVVDGRALAFQFANKLKRKIPRNWTEEQMAGRDWFRGFMRRHPEISFHKSTSSSSARVFEFSDKNLKSIQNAIPLESCFIKQEPIDNESNIIIFESAGDEDDVDDTQSAQTEQSDSRTAAQFPFETSFATYEIPTAGEIKIEIDDLIIPEDISDQTTSSGSPSTIRRPNDVSVMSTASTSDQSNCSKQNRTEQFGQFVAQRLAQLPNESLRRKLEIAIQEAILKVEKEAFE